MKYINHGLAGLMTALIASFVLKKAHLMTDNLFVPFLMIFILAGMLIAFISKDK